MKVKGAFIYIYIYIGQKAIKSVHCNRLFAGFEVGLFPEPLRFNILEINGLNGDVNFSIYS